MEQKSENNDDLRIIHSGFNMDRGWVIVMRTRDTQTEPKLRRMAPRYPKKS